MRTDLRRACTGVEKKDLVSSSWLCTYSFQPESHRFILDIGTTAIEIGCEMIGMIGKPTAFHFHVTPWTSCVPTALPTHVLLPAVEVSMHVSTQWDPRIYSCSGDTHTLWSCLGIWNKTQNEWVKSLGPCCNSLGQWCIVLQDVSQPYHIVSPCRLTAPIAHHAAKININSESWVNELNFGASLNICPAEHSFAPSLSKATFSRIETSTEKIQI